MADVRRAALTVLPAGPLGRSDESGRRWKPPLSFLGFTVYKGLRMFHSPLQAVVRQAEWKPVANKS